VAIVHGGTPLIALIALGLVLAFIGGFIAVRLRLSPIIGYLVAGIIMGPHTPGFTGDAHLASEIADIGVILLMFGVGMHFSVGDLWAMRTVAVPGAIIQILVATTLGAIVANLWGWTFGAGLIFGLALSVASTVVLLRALQTYQTLDTPDGKIAIGWLVVEDMAMIVTLVLLPAVFGLNGGSETGSESGNPGGSSVWLSLGVALVKVAVFIGIMLVLGTRLFPWILRQVERTGSRELFTLAVVALAIGVAFGAEELFGCSFALGAFFAGVVIHQSDLSHRAAATLEPLQAAFGTLFFVAIGMLFDPMILVRQPLQVLIVVAIIMVGKSLAAFGIVLALRRPLSTALMVSAALAQIGEFSFILAAMGVSFGLISIDAESLIIAGALLSIALNPLAFSAAGRLLRILPAVKIKKRIA
jgi:CPA2 family monovalent cation:H+ antiporter-2